MWSMQLAGGHLIYTLDDPYIHLALAETILQGGYGINMGEHSAPSSSIIYPLILALTEWSGLGDWGPLLINMLAMGYAVYLTGDIIEHHVLSHSIPPQSVKPWQPWPLLLGLLVILNMNAWALVMVGMEHSLHVVAVVMVIRGFLQVLDGKQPANPWLIAAIVAMPLIRFEGLAMALAAMALLYWLGERRAALTAGLSIALALAGWYWLMRSLGLSLLPSSVLLNSGTAAEFMGQHEVSSIFSKTLINLADNLSDAVGVQLLAGLLLVAILALAGERADLKKRMVLTLAGLALPTGLAQLLFGGNLGFARYESYALSLVTLSLILLLRTSLNRTPVRIMVVLLLLIRGYPYLFFSSLTPWASQGIYLQQYQMHRFITEYWKQPVGVNDIGWVSYHNPSYVLDLFGLGSAEICRMKLEKHWDSHSLERLAKRKNVHFFMIYDDWFEDTRPAAWQKIATLKTPMITSAGDQVSFYVSPDLDTGAIRQSLTAFARTLPIGTTLELNDQ